MNDEEYCDQVIIDVYNHFLTVASDDLALTVKEFSISINELGETISEALMGE